MKKILFLILFLAGISPVFKNNSLNLGCSQAYSQDMNGGELEEVFICSNRIEVSTSQQGDWLVEETCHLENEDGVATNPCVSICEETDVKWNPSGPCIDPFTGLPCDESGDPDPDTNPGGTGGGSGGSGSGGGGGSSNQIWFLDYDGDGYHSETYEAETSPGNKWSSVTSGLDCDDTKPQYTRVCCTKTCDSGYELNIDTCNCVLLPPCWGTIQDFETSNSFNTNTILNKLNSTLGDFGISADVMDSIKQMNLFDPKTIATGTDLVSFADDLGVVGDGLQVALDYSKYIDEPSTQNLLRTVLDAASMALSPAASLALSTIDYFKDNDGNSKLDLLLKAASDAIDRSLDCNLGLGIRNWVY